METYLPEIIKLGGGALIIYLIILLVNALTKMLQAKTNNGQGKDIQDLKKKVNNEYLHEFEEIRGNMNELRIIVMKQGERISWIEAKINDKLKL